MGTRVRVDAVGEQNIVCVDGDGLHPIVVHENAVHEHSLFADVYRVHHQPSAQPPAQSRRLPQLTPSLLLLLSIVVSSTLGCSQTKIPSFS